MKKNDWYEQIEAPIRPLVRLLRDNGFNTFCSCGHEKTVQIEWYLHEDIKRLYSLLWDNGYTAFELRLIWPSSNIGRFVEIKILV
jgi:hypothetical protein